MMTRFLLHNITRVLLSTSRRRLTRACHGNYIPLDKSGFIKKLYEKYRGKVKVRIGIGLGQWPIRQTRPDAVFEFIDFRESLDVAPGEVRRKLRGYIAAGTTKFVMRLCGPRPVWREQVELLASEVTPPLQTPFQR